MGRDHTLFALVPGNVKFTREPREQMAPIKGQKWIKRPWRKYVNVMRIPQVEPVILKELL